MTTDDLYELVQERANQNYNLLVLDCTIAVFIVAAFVIQTWFNIKVWRKILSILQEAKLFARIAENHGKITDREAARADVVLSQTQQIVAQHPIRDVEDHVLKAVGEVPGKTADAVLAKMKDSSGSIDLPPAAPTINKAEPPSQP
jgi:hypothetical protein